MLKATVLALGAGSTTSGRGGALSDADLSFTPRAQTAAGAQLPLTLPLGGGFSLLDMNDIATPLHIDLLYFGGCPSWEQTRADLAQVLADAGLDATVRLVEVQTPEEADALHFAGSPTVKVNGIDLEGYGGPGVLACRVYQENGGKGRPTRALLERALAAAKTASETR